MTERKTDILNVRLDPSLAKEIDRIATWRGKTASEVARELLQYGVAVERNLEAEELRRHYGSGELDRSGEEVRIVIEARYRFLSRRELAEIEAAIDEEIGLG